jgi:hypothetical protein
MLSARDQQILATCQVPGRRNLHIVVVELWIVVVEGVEDGQRKPSAEVVGRFSISQLAAPHQDEVVGRWCARNCCFGNFHSRVIRRMRARELWTSGMHELIKLFELGGQHILSLSTMGDLAL